MRISRFHQYKVGIAGINSHNERQARQFPGQLFPHGHQGLDHLVDLTDFFKGLQRQLLGRLVDIIGRLDLIVDIDNPFACKSHTQPEPGQAPRLTHRLQHHQVGIIGQLLDERPVPGEIDIGFVNNDQPGKIIQDDFYILPVDGIGRRIVGRADPDDLRVRIHQPFEMHQVQLKVIQQHSPPYLHVVNMCADLIHAISRRINDNIVLPRYAERTV